VSDDRGTQPSEATKPGEAVVTCPRCSTERTSGDRFCETCGYDFEAARAPAAPRWELVIEPDREYHARFAAAGVAFPDAAGAQTIALDGPELAIGRADGAASPPISGAAGDPALSRRHAVLRRRDDGSYAIEDLGSTNGTEINGRPLATGEVVTLAEGDRVYVGAWTVMTIRSRGA
jgi:FHA domain-containing protein